MIIIIVLLKIKKSQHNEQKNIRRNLEKCFPNIGGFLLPYPGKAIVTNQAYNGLVKGDIWNAIAYVYLCEDSALLYEESALLYVKTNKM